MIAFIRAWWAWRRHRPLYPIPYDYRAFVRWQQRFDLWRLDRPAWKDFR